MMERERKEDGKMMRRGEDENGKGEIRIKKSGGV